MSLTRLLLLLLLVAGGAAAGEAKPPTTTTFKVIGLCYPERVEDLRALVRARDDIKLVEVDYDHGQATFSYDAAHISGESISNLVGSKGFAVRALEHIPPEHLARVAIAMVGLDCKGCALGTYNAIGRIDGVERATVDLKVGLVDATIDTAKTNQAALEEALKKAGVTLKQTAAPSK